MKLFDDALAKQVLRRALSDAAKAVVKAGLVEGLKGGVTGSLDAALNESNWRKGALTWWAGIAKSGAKGAGKGAVGGLAGERVKGWINAPNRLDMLFVQEFSAAVVAETSTLLATGDVWRDPEALVLALLKAAVTSGIEAAKAHKNDKQLMNEMVERAKQVHDKLMAGKHPCQLPTLRKILTSADQEVVHAYFTEQRNKASQPGG